jgi:TrpR family trp operon transcriptional repressor
MDELADIFSEITEPLHMRQFLEEILTPSERKDLALRWELMKKLHSKVPQRTIASDLGISLCKITRGARILKQPNSMSRKMLEMHGKTVPFLNPDASHEPR